MFSLLLGWFAKNNGITRTCVVVNSAPSKGAGCVCQAHLGRGGIVHKAGVFLGFNPSFTDRLRRAELNQVIYTGAEWTNRTLNLMKKVKRLVKEHGSSRFKLKHFSLFRSNSSLDKIAGMRNYVNLDQIQLVFGSELPNFT